jgi:D-sedoheptulose 7-phosphate isomerase
MEKTDMTFTQAYLQALQQVIGQLDQTKVEEWIQVLKKARDNGNRLFIIGNGGSGAIASQIIPDFNKGGSHGKPKRFKMITLTDNTPWITALANDISYESVFVEQLKNFAEKGDVLIALSGSGKSPNVLRAVEYCNSIGCETLSISGFGGNELSKIAKSALVVPANHMGRVEDCMFIITHVLAYYFMEGKDV